MSKELDICTQQLEVASLSGKEDVGAVLEGTPVEEQWRRDVTIFDRP